MKKLKICFSYTFLAGSLLFGLSGCESMANFIGYDSQTLNASAAKNYAEVVSGAKNQGTLDVKSNTAKRVKIVFDRLVPYADAANKTGIQFNWQLNVIRSDELNAWAMPGGKMVVYTGIVEKLKLTDAELAAVIGHEMTHALMEHSKKAAGQQALGNMALEIGGSVVAAKTNIKVDNINLTKKILSQYGLNLPFSRLQESQADSGGVRLMAQAGYDPHAAITLWEKMENYGGKSSLTLLSTHPSNANRLKAIEKQLPEVMPLYEASQAKNK